MACALRITFLGALYNVTSRGNERKAVYKANVSGIGFQQVWQEMQKCIFVRDIPAKN
jgi:hypothetical protein